MAQVNGRNFEIQIERVFDQLNRFTNLLAIRIEVKQIRVKGRLIFARKQPFDYIVIGDGCIWAFDAKECSQMRFYPSKMPLHQVDALRKVQSLGWQAGFVVNFLRAPVPTLRWIDNFDSPAGIDSGKIFGWDMFLG